MSFSLSLVARSEDDFPPVVDAEIPRYQVFRTDKPVVLDGKLDDACWKQAPFSRSFVDLISGQPTHFDTRVQVVWDDHYLYFGYRVEEPDVQAKFVKRDSPIWQENDIELFIAGADAYYELEINARGTIYEGLFVWQEVYESAGYIDIAELDKRKSDVRWQAFSGVGFKQHPRGPRWAFLDWDLPGLKSQVYVSGTLNDDSDTDEGWSVEVAIPWSALAILDRTTPRKWPPTEGEELRIDASRFNAKKYGEQGRDSGGWAWSHHGVWDSHIPECFTYLIFTERKTSQLQQKNER